MYANRPLRPGLRERPGYPPCGDRHCSSSVMNSNYPPRRCGMPVSERRSAATVIGRSTRAGSPAGPPTTGLGPGNGASRCGARSRPGPGPAAPRPAGHARARHKPPGRRAGARRGDAGRHSLQTSRHLQFPVLQPRRRGGPAPARIVTAPALFRTCAAAASDSSSGRTTGEVARIATGSGCDGASARNTSPGTTTTATPPRVPRPAAARAHRQVTGQRRLRGRREPSGLLVPDVLPGDLAVAAQRVGEPVQRIPRQPVHPADAGRLTGK